MKNKTCKICNEEFKQKSNSHKFCSDKCYIEYRNKRSRDNYPLIKDKLLQHRKELRKLYKISKICLICKKEFIPNNLNSKCCTEKCLKKHRTTHLNKRREIDINYKIRCYLASRIWKSLKGINKSKSTLKLLGCSIDQLKRYLESQFKLGMSFSNYGKWHIDHIKPCCQFDLSKLEEQLKCFNYTNLQPLWAIENLSKNKKVLGE